MNMRFLHHVSSQLCTLTFFSFRQIPILFLLFLVSSISTLPIKSSDFSSDLIYSDSNDRNTVHNQPGTGDQQVLYINHGNGAISSIRRSLRQPVTKLPFKPHVTSYPSSLFDNHNSDVPLISNYRESTGIPINPSEQVEPLVDHSPPPPPPPPTAPSPPPPPPIPTETPNRRPSRRSTPADNNKPSRIIYDPQPSLSPPSSSPTPSALSQPSPPPSLTSLTQGPPETRRPSRISDPFIPFNFDNIFSRDPTFDIERNVIGNIDNVRRTPQPPPPPPLPRPPSSRSSSLPNHRNAYRNDNNVEPSPLSDSQPSTKPNDESDLNRLKPDLVKITEEDRINVEPRVRKQITGPPSAYSGRQGPQITTPSPPQLFGPTLGSIDGNGFIPSYGPPGFGLPGAQDIFPFFETPFLPISPTSSSNGGQNPPHEFARRRLTNNHNGYNNLGAYGNPNHHTSPPSENNLNDNSIGTGYPSYTIYKGGDDDDAGVKWPKIFKFTDGRVNLSEFERNKKSGKVKFLNKEDAHFEDVRRDSFLILHGGTYN